MAALSVLITTVACYALQVMTLSQLCKPSSAKAANAPQAVSAHGSLAALLSQCLCRSYERIMKFIKCHVRVRYVKARLYLVARLLDYACLTVVFTVP